MHILNCTIPVMKMHCGELASLKLISYNSLLLFLQEPDTFLKEHLPWDDNMSSLRVLYYPPSPSDKSMTFVINFSSLCSKIFCSLP